MKTITFTIQGEEIVATVDSHVWPIAGFERGRDYVTTTKDGTEYALVLTAGGDYLARPTSAPKYEWKPKFHDETEWTA